MRGTERRLMQYRPSFPFLWLALPLFCWSTFPPDAVWYGRGPPILLGDQTEFYPKSSYDMRMGTKSQWFCNDYRIPREKFSKKELPAANNQSSGLTYVTTLLSNPCIRARVPITLSAKGCHLIRIQQVRPSPHLSHLRPLLYISKTRKRPKF